MGASRRFLLALSESAWLRTRAPRWWFVRKAAARFMPGETLGDACEAAHHPLTLRMRPGYDHSYYFIATFIGDHIAHHAAAMNA